MTKKRKIKKPQKKSPTPQVPTNQGQAQITAHHYSGPIPPSGELREYDQVLPGAAERILKMAEIDQQHTHEMEKIGLRMTFIEKRIGQIFALMVSLGAFTAAVVMTYFHAEKAAMVLGGSTILGLVSTFIAGRKKSPEK